LKDLDCLALVLAGGRGSRLSVLTKDVSKPAVHFGGANRLIDFALSNCKHSNIGVVGVLTQYRQRELVDYIGTGSEWTCPLGESKIAALPSKKGGECPVEDYHGTADAIWKNRGFIEEHGRDNVLVLSGDHVYKMDYSKMIEAHQKSGAAVTVAAIHVLWSEASRYGIINTNGDDIITGFEEKPQKPKSNLASMGVYVFNREILKNHLYVSSNDPDSSMDIGRDIIPQMLYFREKINVYRFSGYWRDVGSIDSLWEANMDLLASPPSICFRDKSWGIIGRNDGLRQHFISYNSPNESVRKSLVAEGSVIKGRVIDSVVGEGVEIGEDSNVYGSVIMPGAKIGKGASIIRSIVGPNAIIGDYASVSRVKPDGVHLDNCRGINVIGSNVYIAGCNIKRIVYPVLKHAKAVAAM